jgi:sulfur-oxidizing protein SoxX
MIKKKQVSLLIALFMSVSLVQSAPLHNGKSLTFDRSKGNCLACHAIADGEMAGNIGPPLLNMKKKFTNPVELHKQIWDATVRNPKTSMPPFGRNKILNKEEIDLVVEYIWSL